MNDLDITAMPTPNPNSVKFLINKTFFEKGSIIFDKKSKAKTSPIAKELFEIKGIEQVLVGSQFLSITKNEKTGWEDILESATNKIRETLSSNDDPIDQSLIQNAQEQSENDSEDVIKIKKILDEEIRPAIAMDGGDCQFHSYENGILTLQLQGACSTCPSSVMTLKMGIENRLKQDIEGLQDVVQV